MAMNELRKEVEAAAMAELNRANAKFPLFNSTHEGYAVILEEAEEAQEAMENVKTSLAVLWDRVKGIETVFPYPKTLWRGNAYSYGGFSKAIRGGHNGGVYPGSNGNSANYFQGNVDCK